MFSKTSIKLQILIAIFIVGFFSLIGLNLFFTSLIEDLDKSTRTYVAKIQIGEFISEDIQIIKALFFELSATSTSPKARDILNQEIKDKIKHIESALDVLENGGTLKRVIRLNITGHNSTLKTIIYNKNANSSVSLEVIDVRPKLIDLKDMLTTLNALLEKRQHFINEHEVWNYYNEDRKLTRFYKSAPAFFKRMSENVRRLLYESDIELKNLQQQTIKQKQQYQIIKIALILIVLSLVLAFGYKIIKIINKENMTLLDVNKKLETQEASIRAILDAQPNIIIVSDGKEMRDTNDAFFKFFNSFNSIEDFKQYHSCVCEYFILDNLPSDDYIKSTDYDGVVWTDYILQHPEINFKVMLDKNGRTHHFSVLVSKTSFNKDDFIVIISLNDITKEMITQLNLKHLNDNLEAIVAHKTKELQDLNENLEQKIIIESQKARDKDKQLIQQSRFAALGEMIGNIAHQWRQPLSAINTTASGMILQIELGIVEDGEIEQSYTKIMNYVDFLTQTIEDFRGFFKEDKEKVDFNIIDMVNKALSITSATYKDTGIKIVNNCDQHKEFISHGMPSELSQVFLNILSNAKDATINNDIKNKIVHIRCSEEKGYNVVYIQDNAGGVPKDIIEKIFDPYFTTKHKSQGTGIGLYMSKDIVEKHMNGILSVKNTTTLLDGNKYNGACFKIALPKALL